MKWILLVVALFLAVLLEAAGMALPWTLVILLLATVLSRNEWIFFVAILAGVVLDSVTFRILGSSSLFFVCFLGFMFLYEKKFELQSVPFIAGTSLIGSICYLLMFGWQHIFLQVFLTVFISCLLFICATSLLPKPSQTL